MYEECRKRVSKELQKRVHCGNGKEVKTVPLCPAAALRRLDIGVGIVGDGILKRIQIKI